MEDYNSHTKTQAILNIIKMEDLHNTQNCRAMQRYPSMKPKS
jgi:hypothetical protein